MGTVQKKCKKCHREFSASSEEMDLCPRCLDDEFASADVIKDEDLAEFNQETRINTRRQMSRVEKMNIGYASNSVFSFAGKLNCVFGMLLFLFCVLMFFIGDSETVQTPINQLSPTAQLAFSLIICSVSACLLLFSFKRHKALVSSVGILMVAAGYFMPHFWYYRGETNTVAAVTEEEENDSSDKGAGSEGAYVRLTDEELRPVYDIPKSVSRKTYGIYINDSSSQMRSVLLEAFKRLFIAGEVQVRDCREGSLFIVVNVQNKDSRVAERVLGRIGNIVHSSRGDKFSGSDNRTLVYEVECNEESLADLKGETVNADLYDPSRGEFISLNIKELEQLDVRRVEKAAKRLKDNPSTSFRLDVCVALLRVLRSQPWNSRIATYTQLVETLVQYVEEMEEKDESLQEQVLDVCLSYFKNCCLAQSSQRKPAPVHVPDAVLNYLANKAPDQLVDPVFEQWTRNAVDWSREVNVLGSRMEPKVLALLRETNVNDITRINEIFSYLKRYSTENAVPEMQRFLNHDDQVIQQSAKEIIAEHQKG